MTTQKTKISAIIAAVLAGCIIAAVIILSGYTNAYAVTVNGEECGYVESTDDIDTAVADVENQVAEILGHRYQLSADISYEKVFIRRSEVEDNTAELESVLYDAVPDVKDGYVLKVDGELVGIGDEAELNQAVENAKNAYVNDNTVDVTVLSDVEVTYDTVASDTESDTDAISEVLMSVTDDSITYEVSEGETVAEIADNADVPVEQVIALNPQLTDIVRTYTVETETPETPADFDTESEIADNEEQQTEDNGENEDTEQTADIVEIAGSIVPGQGTVLYVEPETVLLSVQSVDLETFDEAIAYDTEEIKDDTIPAGETEIVQEGQNGTERIYEYVTKLNGSETEREFNSFSVIEEPVTEIISVGTKETEQTDNAVFSDKSEETDIPEEISGSDSDVSAENTADSSETAEEATEENSASYYTYYTYGTNGTVYSADNGGGSHNKSDSSYSAYDYSSQDVQSDSSSSSESTYTYSGSDSAAELRNQIVAYAKQFVGCSYAYGGHGPYVFDCSGLTGYVYAHFGYSLPWTVTGQYACGTYVPLDVSQMLPGDLIFWSYGGSTPTHVGMYIGNGQYIQATKPGDIVRINTVSSYAGQPLVGCRRIIN